MSIPNAPGITVNQFGIGQIAGAVADQVIGPWNVGSGLSYDTDSETLSAAGSGGTITNIAATGSGGISIVGSPISGTGGTFGVNILPSESLVVRAINATGSITSPAISTTNQTVSGTISGGTNSQALTGNAANATALNMANASTGTLAAARGGTGVSNTGTITLGGNLVTSGTSSITLTSTAATNVTLPPAGTLCVTTGSASIVTVGTIATGTWQGSLVTGTYGGTGVNNGANTITIAGNLVTSGTSSLTLTTTGATNVTLPTSGTLSTTTGTVTSIGLTGSTFLFAGSPITTAGSIGISIQPTASISLASITATGSSSLAATALTGALTGGSVNTGAITSSALASGGVVFSGASGLLTVASTLTYATNTLTHTGANNAGVLTTTIAVGTSGSATNRVQNSGGRSMEIGCYGSAVGAYGAVTGNTPYIYSSSGSMVIAAEGSGGIILAAGTTVPQVGSINTASVLLMGVPTVRKGSVAMAGNTSGAVTLSVNAIAGSHSIILPAATGNNGTVPVTDGTGVWTMGRAGLFASASLTYSAILPGMSQDLFITVTGAATNDPVTPAKPATIESGILVEMFVSTSNVICSRAHNVAAIGTITPAVQTFGALVAKA